MSLNPKLNTAGRILFVMLTLGLILGVSTVSEDQLSITMYKLSLTCTAAILGYWIDRLLFPTTRPYQVLEKCKMTELTSTETMLIVGAQIRRALIILATTLSAGLGL